jgi:hypothetical protein
MEARSLPDKLSESIEQIAYDFEGFEKLTKVVAAFIQLPRAGERVILHFTSVHPCKAAYR